jgi:hypothetical protein
MRFGVGFPHCSTRNRYCRPKAAPGENVGRLPKKKFEEQLAALEELRGSGVAPATVDRFRKALANRNNYIVAKASKIAGELGLKALIPDLISALDRFFVDPVKSDP